MSDEPMRELYAEAMAAGITGRGAACPTPEALLSLVRREGAEADRLGTLDHVMACSECRAEFDLLRSIERAGIEAGRADAAGEPVVRELPRRRQWFVPVALAASVLLGVAVGREVLQTPGAEDVYRGETGDVALLAPPAEVVAGAPLVFVWRADAAASRYVLEVVTSDGELAYSAETTDTILRMPEERALAPAGYQWRVRAVAADGAERSSSFRSLRIRAE